MTPKYKSVPCASRPFQKQVQAEDNLVRCCNRDRNRNRRKYWSNVSGKWLEVAYRNKIPTNGPLAMSTKEG